MALYLGSAKMALNLSSNGNGDGVGAVAGVGAYTGQIHFDGPAVRNFFVAYLDSDMVAQVITPTKDCSITVAANTIVTVPSGNMAVASQGCVKLATDSMVSVFQITENDFIVTILG